MLTLALASERCYAQLDPQCQDIENPLYAKEIKRHIGNNKYLLEVLKEHEFELPDDYFDNLDNRGLYKGKLLPLEKVKKFKADSENISDVGRTMVYGGTIYYLPLKIYVYSDGVNDAATVAQVNDVVQQTMVSFRQNGVPIELYIKCSIVFIPSPLYYNIDSDAEVNSMFSSFYDQNAMNIHIVNSAVIDGKSLAGRADRPGNRLLIVKGWSSTTLAHELGHNFGLKHTHHGSGINDNENCDNCFQEPVSRTMAQPILCGNFTGRKKCEVNNDDLCDTPAEPNLQSRVSSEQTGCLYQPQTTLNDNWGVTWQPNTRNIMSYSTRECRNAFTYGQIGVILAELQTSKFNFKSTSATYSMTGPTQLCRGQSYSYSIPSGPTNYTYNWKIPSSWSISGQGTKNVTITVGQTGPLNNTIYVDISSCGGSVAPKNTSVDDGIVNVSGPTQIANNSQAGFFTAEQYSGAYYTWSVPSGWFIQSGQGTSMASLGAYSNGSPGWVSVSAYPVCGQTIYGSQFVMVTSGGSQYRVIEDGNLLKEIFVDNNLIETSVEIYSLLNGQQIMSFTCLSPNDNVDLSSIPKGVFLVRFQSEKNEGTLKLLKQ